MEINKNKNLDFIYQDLKGFDFTGKDLTGSNFMYCNLENANFYGCTLINVNFSGANLQNCDFSYSLIKNTSFGFSNMAGVELQNTNIIDVSLWKAKGIFQFNALGEIPCYAVFHKKGIMVQIEFYQWLNIKQFETKFRRKNQYASQIIYLKDLENRYYNSK